jgi:hypothetical protein
MITTLSFTLKEACEIIATHLEVKGLVLLTNVWFEDEKEPVFCAEIEFKIGEDNARR